jgi:hypothetical protein
MAARSPCIWSVAPYEAKRKLQYKIEPCGAYLKAEMVERDTAAETSEFVNAILEALRSHRFFKVLISIRSSRPVFKVEEWNLSGALEQVMGLPALKVAFVADTREIGMSQEYIPACGGARADGPLQRHSRFQ